MKNICLALMTAIILCSFTIAPAFAWDSGKNGKSHHGYKMKKPDHKRPHFQKSDHQRPGFNKHDKQIHSQKKSGHRFDKRHDNKSSSRHNGKFTQGKNRFDKRHWDKKKGNDRYDGRYSQNRHGDRR